MRKDVKFGLAVGGVLLAVLVAYVLFVPPPGNTTVSTDIPKDTPNGVPDSGNPAGNSNNNVVTDRGTGTDRAADRAAEHGPATVPSGPAITMTPGPADVWGALLTRGPEAVRDTSRDAGAHDPFRSTTDTRTPSDSASLTVTPTPATRPAPTSASEHIVQRGETLTSIATAVYGKPECWQQIAKANPAVDPRHLKINTKLVLPKIDPEAAPAPVTPADPRTTVTPAPATPAAPGTHKVAKGDTLYTISVAHFGNTAKWEKIYELNKATIGADPAKLKIGMVLKLPEREAAPATPAPVAGTH